MRSPKDQTKETAKQKHLPEKEACATPNGAEKPKVDMVTRVRDLIEPLCESEGIELVHVEFRREAGGKILRLFIDRLGGVNLNDCVSISRQAGDILDVYLENTGSYNLEVSSPGPNRPLSRRQDYERFAGRKIKLKTTQPIDGQKNFTGILTGIFDGIVQLTLDDKGVAVPFEQIVRAHLVESANQSLS